MNDVSLGELTNEISEHWFASGVYLPRIIKLKINIPTTYMEQYNIMRQFF